MLSDCNQAQGHSASRLDQAGSVLFRHTEYPQLNRRLQWLRAAHASVPFTLDLGPLPPVRAIVAPSRGVLQTSAFSGTSFPTVLYSSFLMRQTTAASLCQQLALPTSPSMP